MAWTPQSDRETLPPHNLDAELGVLGSILLDNDVWQDVYKILPSPDAFYRESHRLIYQAIVDRMDIDGTVDLITLAAELESRRELDNAGGDDYLATLLDRTPHAVNARFYAQIVRQHALKRFIIEAVDGTLRDAYSDTFTGDEVLETLRERFEEVQMRVDATAVDESDCVREWPKFTDEEWACVTQGVAGDLIKLVEPVTEADPTAILFQFLVAFGNLVGRRPHYWVEQSRHHPAEFLVVMGATGSGRKGTGWKYVRDLFWELDPAWARDRVLTGVASGDSLIEAVRDGVTTLDGNGQVVADVGVRDKRTLILTEEFATVLKVSSREGNILSDVLRNAWDGNRLMNPTKKNPAAATNVHASIIGHITFEELETLLSDTSIFNGFANRFLWVCSKRSKELPYGGGLKPEDFEPIRVRLRHSLEFVRDVWGVLPHTLDDAEHAQLSGVEAPLLPVTHSAEAMPFWKEHYPALNRPTPGKLANFETRAAAHVNRLALIYAVLDRVETIERRHLEAGLILWTYSLRCVAWAFGAMKGEPDLKRLVEAMRRAGADGLSSRDLQRGVFKRKRSAEQVSRLLERLLALGQIEAREVKTSGRPKRLWVLASSRPAEE